MQEAEQLAIYFEEILQHEKKELDNARRDANRSPGTVSGTIGNDEEEYAFEDPELNPNYSDPYDDVT